MKKKLLIIPVFVDISYWVKIGAPVDKPRGTIGFVDPELAEKFSQNNLELVHNSAKTCYIHQKMMFIQLELFF